ncbi:MAG: PspC domain-containing protein, partial [Rikenellaceae bacterium]|nr:PspC domain-containing protein [Rikenellaceae bacterium]
MKKTIDINLGGTAFTIDEDAYQALKNYLDDIVSRLPDEDADVINDIEARLSELLQAHLSIRYQVVDLRMVKAAMGVMGKPDEFGEKKRREEIKESSRNTVLSKKLYRNANDRWLGGVCSGIAAYLDTDT